jgi:hypothetical protein
MSIGMAAQKRATDSVFAAPSTPPDFRAAMRHIFFPQRRDIVRTQTRHSLVFDEQRTL